MYNLTENTHRCPAISINARVIDYKWPILLIACIALILTSFQQTHAADSPTPPETFTHTMTLNAETVTVNFTKFSNRGPNFTVLEQQANGSFITHTPGPVCTYIGSVVGRPGAIAAGIRRADGTILAQVIFEDGVEWLDRGTTVITPEFDPFTPKFPGNIVRNGGAGSTLYGTELGIDLPNVQVVRSGGTTATALEIAEYSTMSMNLVYFRDVAIFHRIERVIVRLNQTADPYNGRAGDSGLLLDTLAEQWNNVLPAGSHDLALVASPDIGGGLAFGSAIGDPGYSSNGSEAITGDFSAVARHEVGHNWSLNHFDGGTPEGPTINSGNDLGKMSGPEMELVLSHRTDQLAVLDNLGTFTTPVPPRAADERITIEPIGGSIPVNVLANDNDTNGSTVSILSFDPTTQKGLNVAQNGNSLTVQAPSEFSPVDDFFRYRIQDTDGMTSTAVVHLRSLLAGDGLGHWTFENSTTRVFDSSSRASHGTLVGDATINANGELILDGQGDYASVPPPNVTTNTITYSAFVFRDGNQVSGAGIVLGSPTDNISGLTIEANNELAYAWDSFTPSGLVIPNQTWTFVAVVIEPNRSTLYMDTGSGMQSFVSVEVNPAKTLTGFFQIGADPDADPNVPNPPYWKGRLDDVRVENRALSATEIAALAIRDLGARNPTPYHTEPVNSSTTTMTWTPAQNMTQQRVYFSNSYTAVRDGTVGSTADQGIVATNSFQQNGLTSGSYYWRIDSTEPNGVIKGNIWTFTVAVSNNAGTIAVTGTPTQGETLTATVTDADGVSGAITYQWKADGTDIAGAINQTFVLTQAEVGKKLSVTASYTDDGASAETPTSAETAIVTSSDNTAPTVDIQGEPASISNSNTNTFMVTFEFSEGVIGFDISDISVANGSAGNFQAIDSNTYTANITPDGKGDITIDVAASVAQDGAGNNNTAAVQAVVNLTDNDGASDVEERAAPNNGDANNDGIADQFQNGVASVSGSASGSYLTIDVTNSGACAPVRNVSITTETALGSGTDPSGFDYEIGLVNFTVDCSSADVVLYLYGLSQAPDRIRKYGFTPTSNGVRVWYQMPATIETLTIAGETVYKVSYTLTDGGLGDDDLTVNGTIVDPVGPALKATPATIPTLSEWAQYFLILLLAFVGNWKHLRSKVEASKVK